jgi:hypothetical protein
VDATLTGARFQSDSEPWAFPTPEVEHFSRRNDVQQDESAGFLLLS